MSSVFILEDVGRSVADDLAVQSFYISINQVQSIFWIQSYCPDKRMSSKYLPLKYLPLKSLTYDKMTYTIVLIMQQNYGYVGYVDLYSTIMLSAS